MPRHRNDSARPIASFRIPDADGFIEVSMMRRFAPMSRMTIIRRDIPMFGFRYVSLSNPGRPTMRTYEGAHGRAVNTNGVRRSSPADRNRRPTTRTDRRPDYEQMTSAQFATHVDHIMDTERGRVRFVQDLGQHLRENACTNGTSNNLTHNRADNSANPSGRTSTSTTHPNNQYDLYVDARPIRHHYVNAVGTTLVETIDHDSDSGSSNQPTGHVAQLVANIENPPDAESIAVPGPITMPNATNEAPNVVQTPSIPPYTAGTETTPVTAAIQHHELPVPLSLVQALLSKLESSEIDPQISCNSALCLPIMIPKPRMPRKPFEVVIMARCLLRLPLPCPLQRLPTQQLSRHPNDRLLNRMTLTETLVMMVHPHLLKVHRHPRLRPSRPSRRDRYRLNGRLSLKNILTPRKPNTRKRKVRARLSS
jgi:hypothetical protein